MPMQTGDKLMAFGLRDRVIQATAEAACQRVTEAAITGLKKQKAGLSGDDSRLKSVWDEFCVQVQDGESMFWDAYELTAKQFIEGHLAQLPRHEREAIWLQTDAGFDWLWDLDDSADDGDDEKPVKIPANDSDSADHIYRQYVLPRAEEYSSESIDAYFEQRDRARAELDRG